MEKLCSCTTDCTVSYGTCHCGCGGTTRIAPNNSAERGWVKGEPVKWLKGHSAANTHHVLSEIDPAGRTALCAMCGKVTVKKNGGTKLNGEQKWKCCRRLMSDHRLSQVNELDRTAFCRGCEKLVPIVSNAARGTGWVCAVKSRADSHDYRAANHEVLADKHLAWRERNRQAVRDHHLVRNYGIDRTEFNRMLVVQDGKCAICGHEPTGAFRDKVLHVDHDHETGAVRALLCSNCNKGLGNFQDTPDILEKALHYLRKHGR
jgi:hypothetical protein